MIVKHRKGIKKQSKPYQSVSTTQPTCPYRYHTRAFQLKEVTDFCKREVNAYMENVFYMPRTQLDFVYETVS